MCVSREVFYWLPLFPRSFFTPVSMCVGGGECVFYVCLSS